MAPIIEDCAQALGAKYRGRTVGTFGHISVFSFYATKVICSGEGGMVCTNSKVLAGRVRDLNQPYLQANYKVRYNYKMSDLTAGLALSQSRRLDKLIHRRRVIADRYMKELMEYKNIQFQEQNLGMEPIYYRFIIRTRRLKSFIERSSLLGVACDRPIFRPLHSLLRIPANRFPNSTDAWRTGVSIPLYPSLSDTEIETVIATVKDAL